MAHLFSLTGDPPSAGCPRESPWRHTFFVGCANGAPKIQYFRDMLNNRTNRARLGRAPTKNRVEEIISPRQITRHIDLGRCLVDRPRQNQPGRHH